ncbi:hypothetical protein TNCV_1140821 [Trichonephila clavipes]|nr:hypothetical protein TNCV_1140821 [Trichonephila clavipes]
MSKIDQGSLSRNRAPRMVSSDRSWTDAQTSNLLLYLRSAVHLEFLGIGMVSYSHYDAVIHMYDVTGA